MLNFPKTPKLIYNSHLSTRISAIHPHQLSLTPPTQPRPRLPSLAPSSHGVQRGRVASSIYLSARRTFAAQSRAEALSLSRGTRARSSLNIKPKKKRALRYVLATVAVVVSCVLSRSLSLSLLSLFLLARRVFHAESGRIHRRDFPNFISEGTTQWRSCAQRFLYPGIGRFQVVREDNWVREEKLVLTRPLARLLFICQSRLFFEKGVRCAKLHVCARRE